MSASSASPIRRIRAIRGNIARRFTALVEETVAHRRMLAATQD